MLSDLSLIPPQALRWVQANAELGTKQLKRWTRQTFSKNIGRLQMRGDELSSEFPG